MEIKTPEELLNFMKNNISYGYLGKNGRIYHNGDTDFDSNWYNEYILETNNELLNNLCGNCFDQVEFERNWFLEHGYKHETIFEMVLLNYENEYPAHAFLIYKDENNNWCWFENADYNNRGIHRFKEYNELIKYQYQKYIESLKNFDISDEEITKIIMTKFEKPKMHITAKEYLNNAINSKKIIAKI